MDPDSPLLHSKHVFRAGFLFLLGIVLLITLRTVLVPDTWGEFGPYRGDSVREYMQIPTAHGGVASCFECHEEQAEDHADGSHSPVSCEICHAPLATHAAGGEVIAEMAIRKSQSTCLRCHARLTARPHAFPQISPVLHLDEMGGEPGDESCFECHDPHSPA